MPNSILSSQLSVFKPAILIAFLLLMATEANAGLIGSQTRVDHVFQWPRPWAQPSATGVVAQGPADAIKLDVGLTASGYFGYEVDLNQSSLIIDFYNPQPESYWLYTAATELPVEPSDFPSQWFHGLLITNAALDIDAFLNSFVIESQVGLIDYFYKYDFFRERVFRYDDSSLALDFQGLRFSDTSALRISFSQPIPLPSTIALVALVLFCRSVFESRGKRRT